MQSVLVLQQDYGSLMPSDPARAGCNSLLQHTNVTQSTPGLPYRQQHCQPRGGCPSYCRCPPHSQPKPVDWVHVAEPAGSSMGKLSATIQPAPAFAASGGEHHAPQQLCNSPYDACPAAPAAVSVNLPDGSCPVMGQGSPHLANCV